MTATLPQLDPCTFEDQITFGHSKMQELKVLARPNVSHVTDEDRHINRERHHRSHENLKQFLETNKHRHDYH